MKDKLVATNSSQQICHSLSMLSDEWATFNWSGQILPKIKRGSEVAEQWAPYAAIRSWYLLHTHPSKLLPPKLSNTTCANLETWFCNQPERMSKQQLVYITTDPDQQPAAVLQSGPPNKSVPPRLCDVAIATSSTNQPIITTSGPPLSGHCNFNARLTNHNVPYLTSDAIK